jgi:hypothetical protein
LEASAMRFMVCSFVFRIALCDSTDLTMRPSPEAFLQAR